MSPKPDAEEIRSHMRGLVSSLPLKDSRKYWPHWLFRSDHVENAALILNSGKVVSRAVAESNSLIVKDAGSPQHINELALEHRNYVRLYFRPRTPTQYANEGIRPKSEIEYAAHMPVPIFLLFSVSLLTERGVRFSRGRLMRGTDIGETAEFLREINFSEVYHDSAVGRLGESQRRSNILNARHSEVLVKDELPLTHLKHIVCRSASERETFLNLLEAKVRSKWISRIHVDEGQRRLFYKRGIFVEGADLSHKKSRLFFYTNIGDAMRGPFNLHIAWTSNKSLREYTYPEFVVSKDPLVIRLPKKSSRYRLRITLNGDLAYFGVFDKYAETIF